MDDMNPTSSIQDATGGTKDGHPDASTTAAKEVSEPVGGNGAAAVAGCPISGDVSGSIPTDQVDVIEDMDTLIKESGIQSPYFHGPFESDLQDHDNISLMDLDSAALIEKILAHDAVPDDIEIPRDISRENLLIAYHAVKEFPFQKQYLNLDEGLDESNQFGLKNGFTGRKHGRNQWVCSCSSNSNSKAKQGGKKIVRADSSLSSNCDYKVFFSMKKDKPVTIMKLHPFHNHPCNPTRAKALAKKSGRANSLAVQQLIDVLGPMMLNGNKINISQARRIMRAFVCSSFDLSSQSIFNVLVGVRMAVEKGHYKIPKPVQQNPFEAVQWNLSDKSSENIRKILAEIYECKDSERSWIVMSFMERLKREDDSFDYRVNIDHNEEIDVVT